MNPTPPRDPLFNQPPDQWLTPNLDAVAFDHSPAVVADPDAKKTPGAVPGITHIYLQRAIAWVLVVCTGVFEMGAFGARTALGIVLFGIPVALCFVWLTKTMRAEQLARVGLGMHEKRFRGHMVAAVVFALLWILALLVGP